MLICMKSKFALIVWMIFQFPFTSMNVYFSYSSTNWVGILVLTYIPVNILIPVNSGKLVP